MAAKQAKKWCLLAGPAAVPSKTLVLLLSKRGIFCHRGLEEMNVAGPKGCVGTVSGRGRREMGGQGGYVNKSKELVGERGCQGENFKLLW